MEAKQSILPNLRIYWLGLARIIWVLIAALSISLFILGTIVQYDWARAPCTEASLEDQPNCRLMENTLRQFGWTWDDLANFYVPIATIASLPWILIGCLVFWRKSENSLALFFSLVLVMVGSLIVNPYFFDGLLQAFPALHVLVVLLAFLSILAAEIFLYLFPDGNFVPRWTRWFLILWIAHTIYIFISEFLLAPSTNLLWSRSIDQIFTILMIVVAIYAMIFRYQYQAESVQRQQIKWVAVALIIVSTFRIGLAIPLSFSRPDIVELFITMVYLPFYYLSVLVAGVCIGISISRYRLWNIDFLLNRTLVYSLLTAIIVGIYVIVVGILGTTIQGRSNFLISILATGLVAVLVQPLRDRLQRGVNRMMYGERDDPVTVLSRLGQRLEGTLAPDAVLPSLVETVAQTLKLPYVAIVTVTDGRHESQPTADSSSKGISSPAIAYGNPQPDAIRFPLIYQSERIGYLRVGPRAHGEALTSMDRHLLENIAHQAAMAVHAVSLTADLQRSRQRLVTAREEERRRLRRDLHDGLGPNLASQGLKLAAVKQLLEKDPSSAIPLLQEVLTQNKSTVEDVRRLVYGLRPPALDELGLVAAIRDYVAGMDRNSALEIEITEPPNGLPPLSAAVEVAAYRIVLEALTNVIRHAQATHCAIRFSLSQNGSHGNLQIEIADDGIGLPRDLRSGVGLRSMRERAEELDGKLMVESQPSVTRLLAILPISGLAMQTSLVTQTLVEKA